MGLKLNLNIPQTFSRLLSPFQFDNEHMTKKRKIKYDEGAGPGGAHL